MLERICCVYDPLTTMQLPAGKSKTTLRALAGLVALWIIVTSTGRAEPFCETVDLFKSGEGGYQGFHTPGVLVTGKGTILAWADARRGSHSKPDWGSNDIVLRRSTDGGKTWSQPGKVAEVSGPKTKNPVALRLEGVNTNDVTYSNPVLIADWDGTIHMLFCLEYMRCFYQSSADDGLSWSTPVEITGTFERFRPSYPWKVLATGPNHSIQLRNGRLLVPVWLSTATGGNAHRPSVTSTIYSDDHGKTWQAGEMAVPSTNEWVNPNETVAVELADGRVMLNVRNESSAHRRLVTTSKDGATAWSTPKFDESLVEPICMGAIVRYSTAGTGGKNRLLFSNPDNLSWSKGKEAPLGRDRKNMTVKLSYDEGQTWPVSKVLDSGWSAYSDLGVSREGTILCFYGRGSKKSYAGDRLTLVRFNLEWLTDGKDHP